MNSKVDRSHAYKGAAYSKMAVESCSSWTSSRASHMPPIEQKINLTLVCWSGSVVQIDVANRLWKTDFFNTHNQNFILLASHFARLTAHSAHSWQPSTSGRNPALKSYPNIPSSMWSSPHSHWNLAATCTRWRTLQPSCHLWLSDTNKFDWLVCLRADHWWYMKNCGRYRWAGVMIFHT